MEDGIRILVADDEEINRKLLGKLLERHGFVQMTVESGRVALTEWRNGGWDLVILDVNMPDMGGMATAKAIREEEAVGGSRRTPILALTAAVDEEERTACLAAGMDAILAKPLRIETLIDLVNAFFEGRKYSLETLVKAENDDHEFAIELVRAYLKNEPAYVSTMLDAVARGDAEELKKAAHKLRGALCIIRAGTPLVEIVRRLEDCGSGNKMDEAEELVPRARLALGAFSASLAAIPGASD